jgi:hypothetical protein
MNSGNRGIKQEPCNLALLGMLLSSKKLITYVYPLSLEIRFAWILLGHFPQRPVGSHVIYKHRTKLNVVR